MRYILKQKGNKMMNQAQANAPDHERVVTIEDCREIKPHQKTSENSIKDVIEAWCEKRNAETVGERKKAIALYRGGTIFLVTYFIFLLALSAWSNLPTVVMLGLVVVFIMAIFYWFHLSDRCVTTEPERAADWLNRYEALRVPDDLLAALADSGIPTWAKTEIADALAEKGRIPISFLAELDAQRAHAQYREEAEKGVGFQKMAAFRSP
jgi:hypothetical protein